MQDSHKGCKKDPKLRIRLKKAVTTAVEAGKFAAESVQLLWNDMTKYRSASN